MLIYIQKHLKGFFMKKNIAMALLTSFLLIGCGGGSSSTSNNQTPQETTSNQTSQSEKLSPPNWIQGTWMDRTTEPLIHSGWLFTSDDMYTIVGENSISVTATLGSDDTITETKTDNIYEFTIHHNQSDSTETFKFKKISSTQIAYINSIDNTEVNRATKE